jgi:signal transduction histidine kinase
LALLWDRMDKAKIDDRLNRIRDQVIQLTAITDDVLQLTRLQTGRSKFEPAPGDLDDLCGRVVRDLAELPGYRDRIRYECAQRPMPAVFDARLLLQAIGNLLHNALKYSPPEKNVHITLAQAPTQNNGQNTGEVSLRIRDEGIGIPAEDLPRLFEPFNRAANVGAIQGTGLGLAIAKEAVELHGGTITVESRLEAGTTFTVTLPAHPPA